MNYPYICVAGFEVGQAETRHVRPLPRRDRLDRWLLRRHAGPFDIGSIVDLGDTRATGSPPEVEDHEYQAGGATYVSSVDRDEFWALLEVAAKPTLADIFGPELQPAGRTMAVEVGKGQASLGILRPGGRPTVSLNSSGKPRLELSEGSTLLSLAVADLRLWQEDHQTARKDAVRALNQRLSQGTPMLLSVGLSRPFKPRDSDQEQHWLQVNNIHVRTNPVWRELDMR
ncbi:MAG TPA: hypothetical protein VFB34_11095 [Chloroflexota bacterium]|nr:hypothetical protein [Chloroflexota bacterium]